MKDLKKWLSICLPILLIAGIVAGWMVVQQAGVTPSEAQVGPGSQSPGPQMQGPPPKLPPKLKASPTLPPMFRRPEQRKTPPGQRQTPTVQGLLEKMRRMPNGPAMIEEAKKRGARIGMGPVKSETSLSWLNPFKVAKAEAQAPFSLKLMTGNNWFSANPSAYAIFEGAEIAAGYSTPAEMAAGHSGPLEISLREMSATDISPFVGTAITRPCVAFCFNAPMDGWYLVNIESLNGATASLIHYVDLSLPGSQGTYQHLQIWDYHPDTSYSTLVELTAGDHYFYWVISTSQTIPVYEIDVFSV